MKGFLVILFLAFVALFAVQSEAQCNGACPALYAPVCGDNGSCLRQFGNSCEMGWANCEAKAKGASEFKQVAGVQNCPEDKLCQ